MFTLEPENWYALQWLRSTGSAISSPFTPVFMEKVIPRKTGQGMLGLQLYMPEGERRWEIRVPTRTDWFMVVEIGGQKCALLQPITFEWLRRFCPKFEAQYSFPPEPRFPGDVQFYLDQAFRDQVTHTILCQCFEEKLVFEVGYIPSSESMPLTARGCGLAIEAEHLLALSAKVREWVQFYSDEREDHQPDLSLNVEYRELDVLVTGSLRFDGYKYVARELGDDAEPILACIRRTEVPSAPLMQMTMLHHLQRYLMKWGGEHEPLNGKQWRCFRELFLQTAHYAVPLAYQHPHYYRLWLHNFEPCREQAVDAVRRAHESTAYDDNAPPVF